MKRYLKWMGLLGAVLMFISCFMPWVLIEQPSITVTGIEAPGTNFGKPGYMNLVLTVFFIVLTLIPRVWAKRLNLVIVAINIAWAIRNYLLLTHCFAGDCPVKQIGLFLMVLSSLMMLIAALFPDMELPKEKNNI